MTHNSLVCVLHTNAHICNFAFFFKILQLPTHKIHNNLPTTKVSKYIFVILMHSCPIPHWPTACADIELIVNVHFTHIVLVLQVQTQVANRVPNKTKRKKKKQERHSKHWVNISIYTTNTQLLGEGALPLVDHLAAHCH